MLKQKAPNNEMNKPSSGTEAAIIKVNIVVTARSRSKYFPLYSDFLYLSPT